MFKKQTIRVYDDIIIKQKRDHVFIYKFEIYIKKKHCFYSNKDVRFCIKNQKTAVFARTV